MALQTPGFYLAGSKRARKPGFLRSLDRRNPQFEQAFSATLINYGEFPLYSYPVLRGGLRLL
ncbi:MAG: hypothetical protein LBD18_03190 [Treponema sp.]|nr:hypothetical protein [Treponema sp.]